MRKTFIVYFGIHSLFLGQCLLGSQLCDKYSPAKISGVVESDSMGKDQWGEERRGFKETSGITGSVKNEGVFWVHDDGDNPYVEVINRLGQRLGRFKIVDTKLQDIEDISRTFIDGQDLLLLADTGNNTGSRKELKLMLFKEPEVDDEQGYSDYDRQRPLRTINYRYPGGHGYDSEAVSVGPNGVVYLIRKDGRSGHHDLYRLPQPIDETDDQEVATVRFLCRFDSIDKKYLVTGAEIHPTGDRMVVRGYNSRNSFHDSFLYEYRANGLSIDEICDGKKEELRPAGERQGEAVTYDPLTGAVLHISEGWSPKLHILECGDRI